MARPTKYRPKYIKTAENYLVECKNQHKLPFLQELAGRIGVNKRTLSRWGEANDKFSLALEDIMDYQCMAIQTLGLKSPSMLIFLLETNHGMIRTERLQHEGKDGGPIESIIFTDVATWRRAKENQQKNE